MNFDEFVMWVFVSVWVIPCLVAFVIATYQALFRGH